MDLPRSTRPHVVAPPPAPPLPPIRPGVLQRLVAPLGFGLGTRPSSSHAHRPSYTEVQPDRVATPSYAPLPSQTVAHKTGLPIAAVDINHQKTHAILAGKEILKTVRVEGNSISEDFNLRSNITLYSPARQSSNERSIRRKEYLAAVDVKWSHGLFDNIIATAAENGRIALYDINKAEVELAWLHEHTGQIHRVAFDPHVGALLLSGSHDGVTKLWDLRTLERSAFSMRSANQFQGRASAIRDVKWSPSDGVEFITCTDEGVIQKWDIRSPHVPVLRINGGGGKQCLAIDWHPDGRHVACGGQDKCIRIYDFQSDNKRQKPLMALRTPQAIKNLRWRPPCWSAELTESGQWQSTQIATSYAEDDPRLHVWDLRRPHLPFREMSRYNRPATDFLWASKSLVWTVGNEGAFTQTDVSFATQVHEELSPAAACWLPNGDYAVFAEARETQRGSVIRDPAVGFLGVTHERLSGGEGQAVEESVSDDEAGFEGLLTTFRRRQSRAASSKSGKSRASSPSQAPGSSSVLPLDKAVLERDDMFENCQVGAVGHIPGIAAESEVVGFLANAYAPASTERERKAEPGNILQKLEASFHTNADACDMVAMHRTAQSWRILSAVLVPELEEWANRHRKARLTRVSQEKEMQKEMVKEMSLALAQQELASPKQEKPGPPATDKTTIPREAAKTSILLKGLMGRQRDGKIQDVDDASNMTTPIARPLPDSPVVDHTHAGVSFQHADQTMTHMPPLPPSVMASHSTAAAASNALLADDSSTSNTPPSSPEQHKRNISPRYRHKRSRTASSTDLSGQVSEQTKSQPWQIPRQPSDLPINKQPPVQRQEDRRAALRDYRLQARPLLNLEDSALSSPSAQPAGRIDIHRHDSNESFTMFSTSTESSQRIRSLDGSFESPEKQSIRSGRSRAGHQPHNSDERQPSSPPSDESGNQNRMSRRFSTQPGLEYQSKMLPHVGRGDVTRLANKNQASAPLDGSEERQDAGQGEYSIWGEESFEEDLHKFDLHEKEHQPLRSSSVSSSPEEPFHFEHVPDVAAPTAHELNTTASPHVNNVPRLERNQVAVSPDQEILDSASPDLIYDDFRPINFQGYDPGLPFAWSALPLICQAIAFDIREGPFCAQFSAHLLMHVHPFFFHPILPSTPKPDNPLTTVVERLMHASTSSRVVENILLNHYTYLKQLCLFVPMAELRKLCAESDYPNIYTTGAQEAETTLPSGQPTFLSITCAHCETPMQDGMDVCTRCRRIRHVCPICLSLHFVFEPTDNAAARDDERTYRDQAMWAYCHGCGHSAHFGCMKQWLAHPNSGGVCPSDGCGHDCGPGQGREDRIAGQAAADEEAELIRGNTVAQSKDDTWKAAASAAVEKTRRVLRNAGDGRSTQSGDERGSFGKRSMRSSRSGLGTTSRKSVRLVTPGEEQRSER